MNERLSRPSVLSAIDSPKPWGWELWLTSTRPEGAATLTLKDGALKDGASEDGGPDGSVPPRSGTLAQLVAAHPEVLGVWSRRLFGDEMPIFAKLIHTDFPSRVHIGFRRAVDRALLVALLDREQDLMRGLFAALRASDAATFVAYQARYSAWATEQALAAWQRDDDGAAASSLAPFVEASFGLPGWLRDVRANRAAIVETLNEVDLGQERGSLLLSSAGIVHAIFGLSHQTHPLDRSRAALERLFAALAEEAAGGASDDDLARAIDRARLPSLRAENHAPPKNEAWFPTVVDGADVLAEPQQTSDTTYSLADFYTPLTWDGRRVRFRKGEAGAGISREELSHYLADVDFACTPVASIRRVPQGIAGGAREGGELFRLVDEPSRWPFFTAYQLDLTGSVALRPPPGLFEQLVVTRGRVALGDDAGTVGELSSRAPGFIPATLTGRYTLAAREPSTVLIYSVPGARGGAPRWEGPCSRSTSG